MAPRFTLPAVLVSLSLVGCGSADDHVNDADKRLDASTAPSEGKLLDARVHDAPRQDAASDAALAPTAPAEDAGADASGSYNPFAPFGPLLPANPGAAPDGLATQHGDTGASDSTPLPGPGTGALDIVQRALLAACPSVFVTSQGPLIAVCTQIANQTPSLFLLDADTLATLATLPLQKSDLFGGVYPYLDAQGRVVIVDGAQQLQWVSAVHASDGSWTLHVDDALSLASALGSCGSCNGVVGLTPGYDGKIWFATTGGTLGTVDRDTRQVQTLALPDGEQIYNSIASAPLGVAVVTDHALYLLRSDAEGAPEIVWRAAYDRGSARKPGQLSWGSGSTPTFFGPARGDEWLAITDNARPTMNLLVFAADGDGTPLCQLPIAAPPGEGSENSPVGSGHSVFVASTYGYPYAALPAGQAESDPKSAPLQGGMARIDVADDGTCTQVWSNGVRSAAVPKLSLSDGFLYTVERELAAGSASATLLDTYRFTVLDADSGRVLSQQSIPNGADTMQLAGTQGRGRVFYQGTITGLLRIAPKP